MHKVRTFVQSGRFFALILAFFCLSASWIALSGRFSMAYDENTHFGLIQLYGERFTPFWQETPGDAVVYGAVERDPSYLYHFLLSFPMRVLDNFVRSQTAQVLVLRFVNIAIFLLGILVFRRILLRTHAPPHLVHVVLAVFVLIPAVPFLAAQINYDNLLFLVSGLSILLAMQLTERLKREGKLSPARPIGFVALCLAGSLVKYAFLPIFAALVLWLGYVLWRHGKWRKLGRKLVQDFGRYKLWQRFGLGLLLILSLGLFMERYGLNVVRYGTPTPECNQVLSVKTCHRYGSWQRNYELHQQKLAGAPADTGPRDPVSYTLKHWLRSMAHQMVFALNGRDDYFKIGAPLPLPKLLIIVMGALGIGLTAWFYRALRKQYALDMLLLVSVLYVGALWLQGYLDFLRLGQAVAIQGRYLMPVLPLVLIIFGLAFARLLRAFPLAKLALATLCLGVLLFQGGGPTVFILRSDERWYWPNDTVVRVNKKAQNALRPLVVDRF